jgi:hypothetical protein
MKKKIKNDHRYCPMVSTNYIKMVNQNQKLKGGIVKIVTNILI